MTGVYIYTNTVKESSLTWHRRLGHMNWHTLKKKMISYECGIDFVDDPRSVQQCKICAMAKSCSCTANAGDKAFDMRYAHAINDMQFEILITVLS